jgi:hypothetical protein
MRAARASLSRPPSPLYPPGSPAAHQRPFELEATTGGKRCQPRMPTDVRLGGLTASMLAPPLCVRSERPISTIYTPAEENTGQYRLFSRPANPRFGSPDPIAARFALVKPPEKHGSRPATFTLQVVPWGWRFGTLYVRAGNRVVEWASLRGYSRTCCVGSDP